MTTIITAGNIKVARYSCGKLGFRLGSLMRGGIYSCWVMSLFSESKNKQRILLNNMVYVIRKRSSSTYDGMRQRAQP